MENKFLNDIHNEMIKRLKELEKLNSSIEEVICFFDDYEYIDYKYFHKRNRLNERVLAIMRYYTEFFDDPHIKFYYACMLRLKPEHFSESEKLRDEALDAKPELKGMISIPPGVYVEDSWKPNRFLE